MADLINRLRNQIGDTHATEPNITDEEIKRILEDAASEYSRLKNYISFIDIPYSNEENVYDLPEDSLIVKNVKIKHNNLKIDFIDNLDQLVLENELNIEYGVLTVTYIKHFKPSDIDSREINLYFLYAEALCYKLMASKTADFIKFNTGEKMVDESGISKKYLELYEAAEKSFRKRAIRAYGRRMNNAKPKLNYPLPWPIEGEDI
jgi:hypothetical protein